MSETKTQIELENKINDINYNNDTKVEPFIAYCTICWVEDTPDAPVQPLATLKCNHWYHVVCIKKWFDQCANNNRTLTCPLCKNISTDEIYGHICYQYNRHIDKNEENGLTLGYEDYDPNYYSNKCCVFC